MLGSFAPGEAPSLKGGAEDSWPEKDMQVIFTFCSFTVFICGEFN